MELLPAPQEATYFAAFSLAFRQRMTVYETVPLCASAGQYRKLYWPRRLENWQAESERSGFGNEADEILPGSRGLLHLSCGKGCTKRTTCFCSLCI